ncbi:TetR/AcrR family transcriptional regulator (plasmid) [Deinococcus sp. KNUC1210]|uniref:TetR/AcrR family transcriptional regulator n=1 Tax=Deinococcus sp. KNUC1210 TaxID=2917691 RepID=UPI001EF0068E|nr:TetR/AcrR family transcriptional regulator [Deinococcus sp. KNUC1210]ULH18133.1 TetR/AcrR family transcriptional regulator [Deinococcus sp. KNUC1210]
MPALPLIPQTDLRVRRTRRLLTQALIELSAEQPLEAITVRDLTERAEVGYATFFRHYTSIQDLLRGAVDDLRAELFGLLPPLAGDAPEQAGALVFQHVQAHPGLYRLLLSSALSLELRNQIIAMGVEGLLDTFEARPGARVPVEVAAHHFIHSFLSLIEWWLQQDQPHSPERMGEVYCELILRPTQAAALQPRTAPKVQR